MFKTVIENLPMVFSLLMGMGLIVLEVFLPGFGLPGISGIALVGVGTVLVSSFCALMIVAMRLVDYYIIHVKKYFIDYDNIIIPKELRENDEQLLNKVDI